MTPVVEGQKAEVRDFWEDASCGENLYLAGEEQESYRRQSQLRYEIEPYIKTFAEAERWRGKRVLEIGVGLGADHQLFADAGAILSGIDLTQRAIDHTQARFALLGLRSDLRVADAEHLPFTEDSFDLVYSWGVIHHSPNTPRAAAEILRVLKPGGAFKVMIYYKWSLVGFMLWARYALARGKPWRSLADIYSQHLESPGTKAYSIPDARQLFSGAEAITTRTILTHADLLESQAGQRHNGGILTLARRLWPRKLLRKAARNRGLFLLIEGRKPGAA